MMSHFYDIHTGREATLHPQQSLGELATIGGIAGFAIWAPVAMVHAVVSITPEQFAQWSAAGGSFLVSVGIPIIVLIRYWQKTAIKEALKILSDDDIPAAKPVEPRRGSNMRDAE